MNNDKYSSLPIFHFSESINKSFSRKKLNCIIFGNFGAKNFGDESILAGQISELNRITGIQISVVARNTKDVEKNHNVKSIYLYDIISILQAINKADFVIVGGGGIICKIDNISGFIYQLYMLLIYFILPLAFQKKIFAIGLGVYNNTNSFILSLSTLLLRYAKIVTVRDFHSYDLLKNRNIDAKIFKDNSYLMELKDVQKILKDEFLSSIHDKKINIGFALLKPERKQDEQRLVSEITEFIKNNYKRANFWFFPCDFQGNPNDDSFARTSFRFDNNEEIRSSLHFIQTNIDPRTFFTTFKLMNHMIVMRLHGAIFCYRTKLDFTGITYDEKCTSFLNSIGKQPLKIGDLNQNSLASNVL